MTMTAAFLWFNAIAYAGLGFWCAISVDKTAGSLGYKGLNSSGRCEYTAVYGGLQVALALMFLFLAMEPSLHALGLRFSIALYGALWVFRVIGLIRFWPVAPMTMAFAGFEALMLVLALVLAA